MLLLSEPATVAAGRLVRPPPAAASVTGGHAQQQQPPPLATMHDLLEWQWDQGALLLRQEVEGTDG